MANPSTRKEQRNPVTREAPEPRVHRFNTMPVERQTFAVVLNGNELKWAIGMTLREFKRQGRSLVANERKHGRGEIDKATLDVYQGQIERRMARLAVLYKTLDRALCTTEEGERQAQFCLEQSNVLETALDGYALRAETLASGEGDLADGGDS